MKKVMISNGLRGKPNPNNYRASCIAAVHNDLKLRGEADTNEVLDTTEVIDTFTGNRIKSLGRSISNELALADVVYFMDDWEKYDGCRVEHFVCVTYGVPVRYLYSGDR